MKEQFKTLYQRNKRHWEVWVWLWMQTNNKHSVIFTFRVLSSRFNIPKSTLVRVIAQQDEWNEDKIYSEVVSLDKCEYKVTFYPNGKKAPKRIDSALEDALYDYVKAKYDEMEYDYPNIAKHKPYVKKILTQLVKAMNNRGTEVTDQSKTDTFKVFFENIPNWWVENSFTLTSINKNFATIINQIKSNGNGKGNNYIKAIKETSNADYSDIAKK